MLASLVLSVLIFGEVESQDSPQLVYDQRIYRKLFNDAHPEFGQYNKNSPPMRKDAMTRYNDNMVQFNNSIDMFVDWHCEPYINFLQSKPFFKNRFTIEYQRHRLAKSGPAC